MRAFDATTVHESGRSGSLWRIHYSVCLSSLRCDYFKLTKTEGAGTGESLTRFPIAARDRFVADRGWGAQYAVEAGGQVTVRVNSGSLVLAGADGKVLSLVERRQSLQTFGVLGSVSAEVLASKSVAVSGRVCAQRKTEEAVRLAQAKIRKEASSKGRAVQAGTLGLAQYVILFTTVPECDRSAAAVLEWYRTRWQGELMFKRVKSLAQLGCLLKYDEESAKAWLHGKLLAALLVE